MVPISAESNGQGDVVWYVMWQVSLSPVAGVRSDTALK